MHAGGRAHPQRERGTSPRRAPRMRRGGFGPQWPVEALRGRWRGLRAGKAPIRRPADGLDLQALTRRYIVRAMPIIKLDQFQQFAAINVLSDPGHIGGPVVIPNHVQIHILWSLAGGKTARNVLYGRAAGVPSPTPTQAEAIRSALTSGAAWTALAAQLSTATSLTAVNLRSVHTANQPFVPSTGSATPGTAAGIALPNEVAVCVTLRTAGVGQANRGRVYLPGFAVSTVVVDNSFSGAVITAAQTWVQGFTSIFAGQGYTWVIGQPARQSYTGSTGTLHPARSATSIPVSSAICRDNHFDSQRRRGLR